MFLSIFDNFYSQAVIPDLYWGAKSQEQRLQWMAKELQALEDYARKLRDEQEAINTKFDSRLTSLESRVDALEKRATADEQAFEDYRLETRSELDSIKASIVPKADANSVYTKAECDKLFMRLEDTMAWQGWFQGDYCYTLPRDCVAVEAYTVTSVSDAANASSRA